MKAKLINFFKTNTNQLFLLLTTIALFLTNYQYKTILAGWDSWQTDLNPGLGIKRALYGVWQEFLSFGAVAGHAHPADLIRALVIWGLDVILPTSLIRYIFIFSMLFIGALGMHILLSFSKTKNSLKYTPPVGALFYILNFGTIQIFFLPIEAYIIFFAALPWQIYIFLKLLNSKISLKLIIIFIIINLLATPYAFSQQLFFIYGLVIFIALVEQTILKKSFSYLKKGLSLAFLIILINSFWILPQLYFLTTNADVISTAKINQIATQDVLSKNLAKANISDLANLRGFFYDATGLSMTPLFSSWQSFYNNLAVQILLFINIILVFIGLGKKSKYRSFILSVFFISIIFLLANTFPFSLLISFIYQDQLLEQIFRSPFNKFIIPLTISISYFFAFGVESVYYRWSYYLSKKKYYLFIISVIFIISWPAFKGNFISKEMKITIPSQYWQVMNDFNQFGQNKRIALLPEYTHWGWYFTRWGYNGSGFLWFGINQPTISRTFDVWSKISEDYYWQIKTAFEAESPNLVKAVLDKYNIDYLLVDYSLIPVVSDYKGLQYDRIKSTLNQIEKVKLVKKYPDLELYQYQNQAKSFIEIKKNLTNIGPISGSIDIDYAYLNQNDYLTNLKSQYDIYYPLLNLQSFTDNNQDYDILEDNSSFIIKKPLNIKLKNYQPTASGLTSQIQLIHNNNLYTYESTISGQINNKNLIIKTNKNLITRPSFYQGQIIPCQNNFSKPLVELGANQLKVKTQDGSQFCYRLGLNNLDQQYGYLLKVKTENLKGTRFNFVVTDMTKYQVIIDKILQKNTEYIIIPPHYNVGLGYQIDINNQSFNHQTNENILYSIEVYTFPYDLIKQIRFIRSDYITQPPIIISQYNAKKLAPHKYFVQFKSQSDNNSSLILYQSYDQGWIGYYLNPTIKPNTILGKVRLLFPFIGGERIENHYLVNNWANGWDISDQENKSVILIFWPQYLQYAGFFVMVISIFILSGYFIIKQKAQKK